MSTRHRSTGAQGAPPSPRRARNAAFKRQLNKVYLWYFAGFAAFVLALAVLERQGLPRLWIGLVFLLSTVAVYACIGLVCRTTDPTEYYVAGRRVPALYNGMATGADWMSAASFLGMAGTLYLTGYGGLAFIMGWTGGFCLVALLLAPYLRKFGQYTIPDFLGARYDGNLVRIVAVAATVLCSFVYVVAQIYAVGLILARVAGFPFEIGVLVGLGGVLLCSFLGGMCAVTWTQVAQYIILIVAYLVPVVWLSVKQTGVPVPQAVYGYQLQAVSENEARISADPREQEVIAIFKARAAAYDAKLRDVPRALAEERAAAERKLAELAAGDAPMDQVQAARRALAAVPRDEATARAAWTRGKTENEARAKPLAGMPPHAQPFAGDPKGDAAQQQAFDDSRRNFLAQVLCLMIGTAALPHVLMRYYTTPSVREARSSVTWSLFFIVLLYLTAPALAVLVKYEVLTSLVGTRFDELPAWIAQWSKVDPGLLSVSDVNNDKVLQLGELKIGGDIIVLATPEIVGLPYVVSAMVAAGGLAAALSTADGLLLTIANALAHDLYYRILDPGASSTRRVTISKVLLLVTAVLAAVVAIQKPADILDLVSAAFSFAAAAFFPALVLGIFWKRATRWAAALGMVAGLAVTCAYMITTQPWLRGVFGITSPVNLWWGIQSISAGLFGVPVGFAVIVIVSLLTPEPGRGTQEFIESVRYPGGPGNCGG
ncbi:MAG TPA: sodium:solute symporter family protein [Burkholderiaceae bacterium]|nr:sodium:solute symporter family protein [Burkholderiaceae bacterium]